MKYFDINQDIILNIKILKICKSTVWVSDSKEFIICWNFINNIKNIEISYFFFQF